MRLANPRARFEKLVERIPESGCWIWMGALRGKHYGQTAITGKAMFAHRQSWEFHRGPIPKGMCVCHHCDVRCCVNPDHLFLGTHRDNVADMFAKGREHDRKGEAHGHAKLTAEQVAEIRLATGYQKDIAAHFGVSQSRISAIKSRKSWVIPP